MTPEEIKLFEQFKKARTEWMLKFNNNPHFMYENVYFRRYPEQNSSIYKSLQLYLAQSNIIYTASGEYQYHGDDPSGALDALLSSELVFLECASSLLLADHLALREVLGKEAYNHLIKERFSSTLKITKNTMLDFYDTIIYPHQVDDPEISTEEGKDIEDGSIVYILGQEHTFVFHYNSDNNGFNLLKVGPDQYLGFGANEKHPKPLQYYQDMLKQAFEEPLTYADCYGIYKAHKKQSDEIFYGSELNWRDLTDLPELNLILEYGKELERNRLNPQCFTPIRVPVPYIYSRSIGIVSDSRLNPAAFSEFINFQERSEHAHEWKLRYVLTFDLQLEPVQYLKFEDLSLSPAQDLIKNELNLFYEKVHDRRKPSGLILWGSPGTGKSFFCEKALIKIAQTKLQIWVKKPYTQELGPQHVEKLIHKVKNLSDLIKNLDYLTEVFKEAWDDAEVFYLDQVNTEIFKDVHSLICVAAFRYALKNNKKVLVTGRENFMHATIEQKLVITYRAVEIIGPDQRMTQARLTHTWNETERARVPQACPSSNSRSQCLIL